jgi:glycosyltransferase involved in cell wall biosynthesis/peptidoglycan/xylan/chitin deacetylase (PgdA/CDA1 family)
VNLQNYYRRRVAGLLFKRPLVINSQRHLISFTFDDFPRSALLAGAILNRFGLKGTYYVSLGLMGRETATGQMFVLDDLKEVIEQGHELGCHTFAHCDSWDTNPQSFQDSIVKNAEELHRLFPGIEFKNFSYPISLPRPLTKAKTAGHFLSCRGGGQTLNIGTADLNQLSAYFLEKSRDDIQAVKAVIDRNRDARGWLIFATHDISGSPTPFGCTPEFFEDVVQYAVSSGSQILPVMNALEVLEAPGCAKSFSHRSPGVEANPPTSPSAMPAASSPQPLVSILIPAFNAEEWISDTLCSAIAQTWEPKEIIVVDDGSTDQTLAIARQFESGGVRVIEQKNQGGAAARNTAFSLSHGEYIQWLDADDLLAPDKIARQMAILDRCENKRTLLSSPFGMFMYRTHRAQFTPTALWHDLSPIEWLLRKMGQNIYMQTATWLLSRELTEAAGPWDTRLLSDDDGEYFCRVLLASSGVRFVPEAKVYYRAFRYNSLSFIGLSDQKLRAHWLSMQLHIGYLRSLEQSERVRTACVTYMQRNLLHFYPDRSDVVEQAERLAMDLGGSLRVPNFSWKYSWARALFGWVVAKQVAVSLRKFRWFLVRRWDQALFLIETRRGSTGDVPFRRGSDTSLPKPLA